MTSLGASIGAARREAPRSLLGLVIGSTLLVVAVLLQDALFGDLEILRGTPDVVVIVVVAIAIERGPVPAAVAGFVAGLALDVLTLGLLGATSIALVVCGYVAGLVAERMPARAVVRPLVLVALTSLASGLLALLVTALVGAAPRAPGTLLVSILAGALVDVPLAILLLPLARRALRRPRPARPPLGAELSPEMAARLVGPPEIVARADRAAALAPPPPAPPADAPGPVVDVTP